MDKKLNNSLHTVWEILNGAIYDLTEGNKEDALGAVEECRDLIEDLLEGDAA